MAGTTAAGLPQLHSLLLRHSVTLAEFNENKGLFPSPHWSDCGGTHLSLCVTNSSVPRFPNDCTHLLETFSYPYFPRWEMSGVTERGLIVSLQLRFIALALVSSLYLSIYLCLDFSPSLSLHGYQTLTVAEFLQRVASLKLSNLPLRKILD